MGDEPAIESARKEVLAICKRFPVYG
jgi:hypothetical protein